MSKYEDETLELIELVAENSLHHAAKSFGGRRAPSKEGMLDAKALKMSILLDKIKKLTEAQNMIMYSLKIRLSSNGLAPLTCRFRGSLKHKNVGQKKFIKLNSQR